MQLNAFRPSMAVGASPPPAPLPVGLFHFLRRLLLILIAVAFVLLTGCTRSRSNELVVWSALKDDELVVLRRVAGEFTAREGVSVRIVRVPFTELQPKLQVSIPVGQGPDIVTGPHDWIGTFVTAGLLRKVDIPDEERRQYVPVTLKAMSYGEGLYGLPMSVSAIGLVTNRRLVPKVPETMDELIRIALEVKQNGKSGFVFDDVDFYFGYPFFGGYGAYVFAQGPSGYDPTRIGLDSEGGVRAARLLADLHLKYRLMPSGTSSGSLKNSAGSLFLAGELAMTITGPWSLPDYKKSNIDYVFSPIPKLDNGKWPTPLVGVDGLLLSSSSRDPARATRLMLALAGRESEVQLNLSAGRIPSRRDALDDARVRANPDVAAINASVEKGAPMPSVPEMTQVWQPMAEAMERITAGKDTPEEGLRTAVERINNNIRASKL